MLMNIVKAGGYAMAVKGVADRINTAKADRQRELRKKRAKNVTLGIALGTTVGAVAGLLYAPKPGKETRKVLVQKSGNALDTLKENVSDTRDKISKSVEEKADRMRDAAMEYAEAAKEAGAGSQPKQFRDEK